MKKYSFLVYPIIAFIVPLFFYVKTLAPTYIPIDSAEFALCMNFWGICHPPGFPLFIILGKIFTSLVPLGSLMFLANLFSAFWASMTILLIYLTLLEVGIRRLLSLLIALIFAFSFHFWEFSIAADVFTFATFLLSLFFYFSFKKWYLPAVFVLGLSASHFYISAILAPLVYWYFWGFEFKKDFLSHAKRLALSSLVFVLGLFPQALMYLRMQNNPEINWGHSKGVGGFLYFVRRQEFGSIFLLSNPSLKFSLFKLAGQFREYFLALFSNFAVILTVIAPVFLLFKETRNKKTWYLSICFFVLLLVQLTLLSTIDASGEGSPFQLNKFYLSSFVPFVLLVGISTEAVIVRFFDKDYVMPAFFLGLVLLILVVSNYSSLNYSKNYFSQNMVLDALDQLPENSLVITVSHIFYFGSLYEQKINHKYKGVTFVYVPNENNFDATNYNLELKNQKINEEFVEKVEKAKKLGKAESYILDIIARNLDRNVFILQGTFEENFFSFLKPYIRPYGFWWRVEEDLNYEDDIGKNRDLFSNLRNKDIKYDNLELKQQRHDLLNYAVSFNSFGTLLASWGKYDEALEFFDRAGAIRNQESVSRSREFVLSVKKLDNDVEKFIEERDRDSILLLGNNLSTLGNYRRCITVFERGLELFEDAIFYNNLASCNANLGRENEARVFYELALELNPDMDLAKKGVEALKE